MASSCSARGGSAFSRVAEEVAISGDSIFWGVGGEFCEGGVDFLGGGRPGCFLRGLDGAVILREREGGGMESPNIGCALTTLISGFASLQGRERERVVCGGGVSAWGSECVEGVEGERVCGYGVGCGGGVVVWRWSGCVEVKGCVEGEWVCGGGVGV